MSDLIAVNLDRYRHRYSALFRETAQARIQAVRDREYLRFGVLSDEVAMVGQVIAHQARLRATHTKDNSCSTSTPSGAEISST